MTEKLVRALFTMAASIAAVLFALVLGGLLLLLIDKNPLSVYGSMLEYGFTSKSMVDTLRRATPLMISGVAVGIGFKMNLFNIGVEGQYLLGVFAAAVVGSYLHLPAVLHVSIMLIVAMAAGAAWAGIAAVLKVTRGVNEVISTIMLNGISLSVVAFLFDEYFRNNTGSNDVKTKPVPPSGWMPNFIDGPAGKLTSFFLIALAIVALYWVVVWYTPFGFRLRASGSNPEAATTAGVDSNAMILRAMLLSGAVAGLVGLPQMMGEVHAYGQSLTEGLGFAGIAVALLGRNHPIGIVLAALLFAFLDRSSARLQLDDVPKEIAYIIQGVIVMSVVVFNEIAARFYDRSARDRLTGAGVEASSPSDGPPVLPGDEPRLEGAW